MFRIQPNYCTYPYKHTVEQFCSLHPDNSPCTLICFFIKAYIVGTHLNYLYLGSSNEYKQYKENRGGGGVGGGRSGGGWGGGGEIWQKHH